MQSRTPLRIIKLGGSLLSLIDLKQRFHGWLQTQTPARNLIVVGGGQAVEAIRELDVLHRFPTALTHWLCIDLMSVTAKLAGEVLSFENPISTVTELEDFLARPSGSSTTVCILPTAYYTPSIAAQKACRLPESWKCSSDSIAAWLATSLAADQLVLLKSMDSEFAAVDALSPEAIQTLADRAAVDPVFPDACKHLSHIRMVNLKWRMLPTCG